MQKLKNLLREQHISIKDLSKDTKIGYRTLQNYLLGKTEPSLVSLEKIAMSLQVSVDFLLDRSDSLDYIYVPVYDVSLSAGFGLENFDTATKDVKFSDVAFSHSWLKKKNLRQKSLCILKADGDSMSPVISSNDLLLIDTSKALECGDGLYAFRSSEHLFIKQIEKILTGYMVKSFNPQYSSYEIDEISAENLEIIGKCVLVIHDT